MTKRIKNKGRVIRVYISGKISGLPKDEVELKFKSAQQAIEKGGFIAINPLDHSLEGYTYEQLCNDKELYQKQLDKDLELLKTCDVIFLLHDWKESNGAKIEHEFAKANNIMVIDTTEVDVTDSLGSTATAMLDVLIQFTDVIEMHLMNTEEAYKKEKGITFQREYKQAYKQALMGLKKIGQLNRHMMTDKWKLTNARRADELYYTLLAFINAHGKETHVAEKVYRYIKRFKHRSDLADIVEKVKENAKY